EQVAATNATVLIRGESGVGKDIVARAIHHASPRHSHPFVKVNCASFPMDLLESELFGHEKGAFTGAYQRTLGKFELANKGTFFLDEIGELPVALQAKLLHVLQDHAFCRVGGREMLHADVRVIASTNRNLEIAIGNGQFREDLYYRLNVVEIHVPPLRERKEEVPILALSFLDKFHQQDGRKVELPSETITLFGEYSWPGNVRELENTMLRLMVLGNVPQIHEEILNRLRTIPPKPSEAKDGQQTLQPPSNSETPLGLREVARRAAQGAERKAIQEVLERVQWNRSEAARLLKVSYKTLLSKITDCGLTPKHKRPPS
ncbi:MAG: sigma-54 interaction domain-containing protein, partial [Candidatus Methylomirabilis sp.]